jgi:cell division septation protein DedD
LYLKEIIMATAAEILAKKTQSPIPQAGVITKQPVVKEGISKLEAERDSSIVRVETTKSTVAEKPTNTWAPPARTCSYSSRAPNTEIELANKTSIKFVGNFYTTETSREIAELDSLCKRIPNVFTKVK